MDAAKQDNKISKNRNTDDLSEVAQNIMDLDLNNSERTSGKRSGYLSWEDYFMSVAILSAQRSKDPVTQVGACIIDSANKIVGIGYNGMPHGCHDDDLPWGKSSPEYLENKHAYVCHAEMNAVMNCSLRGSLQECELYTVLFPCCDCAKIIIQSGLRKVCFMIDKPNDKKMIASKRMFDLAGVCFRKYVSNVNSIVLNLLEPKHSEIIRKDD